MLLPVLLILLLAILGPLLFGEIVLASLHKLHLSPSMAVAALIAMFIGGLVNIPVKKIHRARQHAIHPLAIFGMEELWPELRRTTPDTIIAVNLGGCLIPVALSAYEIMYLLSLNPRAIIAVVVGSLVNIVVCYLIARPIARIGNCHAGLCVADRRGNTSACP